MFSCLIGVNPLIDCSPLDALALVRALGSKLGLAVALPVDRFGFCLRLAGSGLGLLELPLTVVPSDISLSEVRDMTSGHCSNRPRVCPSSSIAAAWVLITSPAIWSSRKIVVFGLKIRGFMSYIKRVVFNK